jgi:ligand-binding sensor domain-containing protein/signal transduction histidine kinase/AraC-like DNA-binding protein/AmiR/NasT family two-component response regulator
MKQKKILFLLILQVIISFCIDVQSITISKIPYKELLPNSIVKRIFQDQRGFIWFGTESGICRFDGYKLITIKSNIEHPNLLTSGNILCIAEDKNQRIWFGTDRGVNILDQNNQIVLLFPKHKVQDLRINSISCDKNGDMWIGSEDGLFLYDNKKNTLKKYCHTKNQNSLPGNNVSQVFEDKSGIIWVALWNEGLCRFDNKYETFERLPSLGKSNNPFYIYEDTDGNFWVGAWVDGLFKIDFSKGKSSPIYTQFQHTTDPTSISANSIYSITQDNVSGNIWILSQMGLSIITDRKNIKFERVNVLDIFSDASNFLNHLMKDRQGNIWIATSNDGIYLANMNKPLFQSNILNDLKRKFGFITVNSIVEFDNKLWFAIANYGIAVVDKQTQLIDNKTDLNIEFAKNFQRPYNTVNCMCINKMDSSVWIGGNGILARVYKKNNKNVFEKISIKSSLLGLRLNSVSSLFCDSKKRMWIGTRYGVYLMFNNKIMKIIPNLNSVNSFCEDNGTIWIASPSKGIVHLTEFEPNKFVFKQYLISNGKINSNEINTLSVDKKGNLWAGTNNCGLNKYDKQGDRFVAQNKNFSILEDDIKSIIVDDSNFLWLATNNKIVKIDLERKTSIIFSTNDNIKNSSFRANTYYMDKDRKFYFGGGNGFCSFYPNIKKRKPIKNQVVITDIEINNLSIFNSLHSEEYNVNSKTLQLSYKQNNIGFEFSALNFISPSNINYAYKLSGVDKDWVKVDSKRRYVNYNNLNNGKYTFQVKATDENGVWSNDTTTLTIVVAPAPYETWWAYCVYLIILLLIFYYTYRNVSNRILLKHDLLVSKLEKQKSEELTQTKLRYFTNISHELLTPLTIISCLIDDFNYNFPNQFSQYSIMKSNISRLKRLLQQILDFRKVESGNMKLSVKQADLVAFVNNICWNNFDPLAKEKKIKFYITAPDKLIGWFDADKIDKILFNTLSNAFKHTPENGTINIAIQSAIKKDIEYVKLFVSDTGIGISQDRIPYIFDRFYGNEFSLESNGIGLSLTKELVEIHKGIISVESQINVGTTFMVEIPIDINGYTSDEYEGDIEETHSYPAELTENDDSKSPLENNTSNNNEIVILIVEDNVDLLMILANSLSHKYRVFKARNGLEALKVLKVNEVNLVVSDVMMPEMDGITLCKTIKEDIDFSHTPVLLLTAKNQIVDRIECYNAGADAYISKPFEMEVLEARINSLILNRQKKNKEYQSSLAIHPKNYENDSMDDIFLRQAIDIVEANLSNFDFTHEQLIDAMNSSKSTFYRKIKSLTGLSPSEFVRNIRLKHACLMLKSETGNVSDIAYAVGFNDPKYFSTCFKAEFGVSPREYNKPSKS